MHEDITACPEPAHALPEPGSCLVGSDSGAPVVVSWWRP